MDSTTKNSRRKFIGTIAMSATAGLSALSHPLKAGIKLTTNFTNDSDEWFKNVKGRHRVVFDGSEPNDALPIIWTWAFYMTNNMTETPDSDMTAVCVLRHNAIPFALEDRIWDKYKLGEIFNIKDNRTKAAALRNPYYEPKPGDYPFPGVDGIKKMQERGALFAVCNLAISVYSGKIASEMGLDPEKVRKDWVSGVLPGIQIVPSGVWALGRAQENGCQYIYAGG